MSTLSGQVTCVGVDFTRDAIEELICEKLNELYPGWDMECEFLNFYQEATDFSTLRISITKPLPPE